MLLRFENADYDPDSRSGELWQAGVEAIADASAYLTETGLDDLEISTASARALLALARRVLDEHLPHEVCGTTYCLGCQIDVWPCATADHALRAVGALSRSTAQPSATPSPTDDGTPT